MTMAEGPEGRDFLSRSGPTSRTTGRAGTFALQAHAGSRRWPRMADKPGAEKTEKPSAKRQEDARKKGMAARSSELPQAVSLIVAAVLLPTAIPGLIQTIAIAWRSTVSPQTITDPEVAVELMGRITMYSMQVLLPLAGAITVSSILAQLALSGGKPNIWKLKPQWTNLNPAKGLKRLVSLQLLWDLGRTLAKLILLAAVSWELYGKIVDTVLGGGRPLSEALGGIGFGMRDLITRAAAAALVVGVADAVFNKRRLLSQLRMTKQEVTQENKEAEGSPHVKAEIRRRQAALSRNRMIAAVADADVVLTNPTRLAIALVYDPSDGAPRVVAKGAGPIAKRIREEARKHGVPIREDKPLARAIYKAVEVNETIPADFFAAVAAVLAVVYRTRPDRARRAMS